MVRAAPTPFAAVRGQLVPVLAAPDDHYAVAVVPGLLDLSLALDGIDARHVVDERDLRRWGITFDQAHRYAVENLRRRSDPRRLQAMEPVEGLFAWLDEDGLAPARALILRDLVRPWPEAGVIIALPSPHQLLALGLYEPECFEALTTMIHVRRIAEALHAEPVSEALFWHDGHEIHRLDAEATHEGVVLSPPPGFVERMAHFGAEIRDPTVAEA